MNITKKDKKEEERDPIDKRFEEIQRMAGIMQEYLAEARAMKSMHERSESVFQLRQFLDCMVNASVSAEQLTERLRRLVFGSSLWEKQRRVYGKELVRIHKITVQFQEEILEVKLPCLLPHRKEAYTDFIYKPFYLALQDWCDMRVQQGKTVPIFDYATVCFFHEYDQSLPLGRVRDHDNIEEKQVVDALGTFFLTSDSGLYLNTYHTTLLGNEDCTRLYLMAQERFPGWITAAACEKSYRKI